MTNYYLILYTTKEGGHWSPAAVRMQPADLKNILHLKHVNDRETMLNMEVYVIIDEIVLNKKSLSTFAILFPNTGQIWDSYLKVHHHTAWREYSSELLNMTLNNNTWIDIDDTETPNKLKQQIIILQNYLQSKDINLIIGAPFNDE